MVNFFILNKFFSLISPPFNSVCVLLCRQRIRNIHCCYLNKFSSSFISHPALPLTRPTHALLSLFAYYTYCLLDSTLSNEWEEAAETTKRKSLLFFRCRRSLGGGTSAHNILWWTLLRMMMITIIIMNIFFLPFIR